MPRILWRLKIHRPQPSLNPRILGPLANTLTTRPPSATPVGVSSSSGGDGGGGGSSSSSSSSSNSSSSSSTMPSNMV
jgi:hypothetical protein